MQLMWLIQLTVNKLISYKKNFLHNNVINCLCFSPDNKWLVSGDDNGITKLWDLTQNKIIHEFHQQYSITNLLFNPYELVLTTGSKGKVVRFWDLVVCIC